MTPFLPVIGNDTEKIQRMEAGESTPLLVTTPPATVMTSGTTTTTSATGGEGSSRIMSEMPEVCRRELIVTTGAGIGFICNAISMVLSTHPIIMVTSILGLLVTPFAAFQQKKITQARALAQTNQVLAEQVQRLNQETNRLQAQEKQLASSVVWYVLRNGRRQRHWKSHSVFYECMIVSRCVCLYSMRTGHFFVVEKYRVVVYLSRRSTAKSISLSFYLNHSFALLLPVPVYRDSNGVWRKFKPWEECQWRN